MSAPDVASDYHSGLTRAELDAIMAIERMMANGCEGMFTGPSLPAELADAMEAKGMLSSQWMEAHPDHPGDNFGDGAAAYWPTGNGRFLRGMCMVAFMHGNDVTMADGSVATPGEFKSADPWRERS